MYNIRLCTLLPRPVFRIVCTLFNSTLWDAVNHVFLYPLRHGHVPIIIIVIIIIIIRLCTNVQSFNCLCRPLFNLLTFLLSFYFVKKRVKNSSRGNRIHSYYNDLRVSDIFSIFLFVTLNFRRPRWVFYQSLMINLQN